MNELLTSSLDQAARLFPALVDVAVRGTVVLLAAMALASLMKRRSAASRHLVWAGAIASLLVLPVLIAFAPPLRLLPRWTANEPATAAITTSTSVDAVGDAAMPLSVQKPFPWTGVVAAIWLAGSLIVLVRLVVKQIQARVALSSAREIEPGPVTGLVERACRTLHIRRRVGVMRIPTAQVPMTIGIVHPRVLVPADSTAWPTSRWRIVLLHELSHILRWDTATDLLARAAMILFWFHPLARIARRQLTIEQERACDDLVLGAGVPGAVYAQQLLNFAARLRGQSTGATGLSMAQPSTLEVRMRAILSDQCQRGYMTMRTIVSALFLTMILAWPVAALQAVESPPPTSALAQERGEYQVTGDVRHPGAFKIDNQPTTLTQALTDAGVEKLDASDLVVTFLDSKSQPRMSVPFNLDDSFKQMPVAPGDVLIVKNDPDFVVRIRQMEQHAREIQAKMPQMAQQAQATAAQAQAMAATIQQMQATMPQMVQQAREAAIQAEAAAATIAPMVQQMKAMQNVPAQDRQAWLLRNGWQVSPTTQPQWYRGPTTSPTSPVPDEAK